ncbi:hypothetical protein STEG23_034087, partial [Scotinomys teguina]
RLEKTATRTMESEFTNSSRTSGSFENDSCQLSDVILSTLVETLVLWQKCTLLRPELASSR